MVSYDAEFTLSAEAPIDRRTLPERGTPNLGSMATELSVIRMSPGHDRHHLCAGRMASQLEDLESDVIARRCYRTSTAAAAEQAKLMTERDRKDEARKNRGAGQTSFRLEVMSSTPFATADRNHSRTATLFSPLSCWPMLTPGPNARAVRSPQSEPAEAQSSGKSFSTGTLNVRQSEEQSARSWARFGGTSRPAMRPSAEGRDGD